MKKINELIEPVKNVGKVWEGGFEVKRTDEQPLMTFSPPGESWVEVLGHRFEGVNGFEGMIDYLSNYRNVEKELDELLNQRAYIIDYLVEKLEVAKLMATYENGVRYPSIQEMIYEDILSKFEKK